ncbi:MAG: hypothetical protein EU551_00595 [Promethearchaeota archaeon]|nr:MAG: hypothetical protein EU551_00595 [Candidatus Lokiarchaeota archaeon]
MDNEPLKSFKNVELIWLFAVDLIKPIHKMDITIDNITKCSFCQGMLKYYNPTERVKGIGEIKIYCDDKNEEKACNDILQLFMDTDFLTLDEDYLEASSYVRFLLNGPKIKFPVGEKYYDVKVIFTLSSLGIGIFSFWADLDFEIDSKELAKLQISPLLETRDLAVELPIEILKELTHLDKDYLPKYEKLKNKDKKFINLKKTSFEELIGFYWNTTINRLFNLKYKSQGEITNNLRSESYCVFPMVVIHSDEYEFADDFIKENPRQLYQILSHMYNIDHNLIYPNVLDEVLEPNITERRDIAYLDALGSVVLLFGSKTKDIIKNQMKYDKKIISVEGEYQKLIFESFIIVEILQLQRQYLNFLTQILTRPITEMSPREISTMRSYLSKALDFYHGNVTGNSLARKRIEHGKDITEIDESFEAINEKMDLLGDALESFNDLRTSFFEIALGLILGIVPMFYILIPFEEPLYNSIAAIGITVGIILTFTSLSRLYWKRLKKKEIK